MLACGRALIGQAASPSLPTCCHVPQMPKMSRFPGPNSVLVLDNASIHRKDDLRVLIEDGIGGVLEFLPPYSPDYNPIEKSWCVYKTFFA